MDEDIFASFVWDDETVPCSLIEKLYLTSFHSNLMPKGNVAVLALRGLPALTNVPWGFPNQMHIGRKI